VSPPGDIGDHYKKFLLGIEDVSCLVADALGKLGIGGYAGLPGIFPVASRTRACGPAFTVRYEADGADRGPAAGHRHDAAFDFSALFARGQRGAIAVVESPVRDVAVLGSKGINWARHFGMAGVVVSGAVRDVEALTASEVPVWARHVTPAGGRGILVQAEIGGPVSVGHAVVNQDDFVVADSNGLAVIPSGSLDAVASLIAELKREEDAAAGAFNGS
jgi:regulator of RNase E activity RraA